MPGVSRVYWNDRGAFPVSGEVFSSHVVWKCLFHSTCCFDFWFTDYKCFAKAPDPSFLFCFPGTWGSATVSKALRYKYPRTNVLWAAPSVPLIRQCRHKGSRGLGVFFVTASFLPLQPRWATLRPSFTTRVSTSRPTLSGKYRHYSRVCNGEVGNLFYFCLFLLTFWTQTYTVGLHRENPSHLSLLFWIFLFDNLNYYFLELYLLV